MATAPLLAHHFGTVSVAALPANLLALPAVAPAMWLGMVKAALGQMAIAVPAADTVAETLGPLAGLPVGYLGLLAARFADIPGGQLSIALPGSAGRCARLRRAGGRQRRDRPAARRGWAGEPRRRPRDWRRRPRLQRQAAACVAALALVVPGGDGGAARPRARPAS